MKNIIKDGLIIWLGATALLIFIPVFFYGTYYIHEPTLLILVLEVSLGGGILMLGFYWLIKDIRGIK